MKRAKAWKEISPNFIHELTPANDVLDLISPKPDEIMVTVTDDWNMEDVVVNLGKFPSKSQARKNGWTGPIPEGFNVWQIGKDFQFVTLNTRN